MRVPDRVVQRVLTKVAPGPSGCIETTYSVGSHGYGQVGWHADGKIRMALTHRVAWMAYRGEIPEGMHVDHICRNRLCLNPLHLRLLTASENCSDNGWNRRTHCPSGHPYEGSNLYVTPGGERRCRQCARDRRKAS